MMDALVILLYANMVNHKIVDEISKTENLTQR